MEFGNTKICVLFVVYASFHQAHILAAETPGAEGRYLTVAESMTVLQMADALRDKVFLEGRVAKGGL